MAYRPELVPVGINDVGKTGVEATSTFVSSDADSLGLERNDSNPFLDPKVERHYRQLYEDAKYECRDYFDPKFQWTAKEEDSLRWKLEWRVCATACLFFFSLQVDRQNLSQAVSDNFLKQLHLTTNDFNTGELALLTPSMRHC